MSDTTPNTTVNEPSTSSGPIDVPNGGAPGFDELESMFLNKDHKVKTPKAGRVDKDDTEGGKSKDFRTDSKGAEDGAPKSTEAKAPKESKPRGDKASEDDEPAEEAQQAKLEAQAKKILKARLKDQDLDLDEDTEIPVKVNGEIVHVKVSDLGKNYSGKTAWEKKFSEVDNFRRQVMQNQGKLDSVRNQIKGMFEEQDPNARLFKMAQLSGMDPVQFRRQFFDSTMKDIEAYSQMPEHERKARDMEFENSYLRHQADAAQKTLTQQQSQQELHKRVQTVLQTSGVPQDTFVTRYEEIMTGLAPEHMKFLEAEGKVKDGEPTPEFIIETIQKDALYNSIATSLAEIKHGMDEKRLNGSILSLVNDAYQQGMKAEDMPEIVSEVWGKGKAKRVVESLEQERREHLSGRSETLKQTGRSNKGDMLFFDDL